MITIILWIIGIYLLIGMLLSCFALYMLWGKGYFETNFTFKNVCKIVFPILFLWGTIPFRKKIVLDD